MILLSTGPVERGEDTDRVRVLAYNTSPSCRARVVVVIRNLGPAWCRRILLAQTRIIPPRRTVAFDADLGPALRYEVRAHASSGSVLFYVSGYRPARWWPGTVPDPSATFRHTELVRLRESARHGAPGPLGAPAWRRRVTRAAAGGRTPRRWPPPGGRC